VPPPVGQAVAPSRAKTMRDSALVVIPLFHVTASTSQTVTYI
jgi:hypothetical protein